jgi:prepilin peptidase CpaA
MAHVAAVTFALSAGILDARAGRIPNWLTLPGMGLAFVVAFLQGGASGLLLSSVGLVLCGGVLAVPFFLTRGSAMGGGDVKCWAALGAMLGPGLGLSALLSSLCLLVLFALFRETYHGRLTKLFLSLFRVLLRRPGKAEAALTTMRFGPAIALGTFVAVCPDIFTKFLQLWP